MNRQQIRSWPAPLRIAAQILAPTGQHRARPHGAAVDTEFRHCPVCGVDTAVVVHADGSCHCTEGHPIPAGGAE